MTPNLVIYQDEVGASPGIPQDPTRPLNPNSGATEHICCEVKETEVGAKSFTQIIKIKIV